MEQDGSPSEQASSGQALTKDRILDAALELFGARGTQEVSIRDLARAVGIKESSFYNHFASKDALVAAVFDAFAAELARTWLPSELLEALTEALPLKALLTGGAELFRARMTAPRMRRIWRVLMMERARDPRAAQVLQDELLARPLGLVEATFRRLIDKGLMRRLDPAMLAAEYQVPIVYLCSESVFAESSSSEAATLEKRLSEHIQFFWEAVKPAEECA